VLLDFWPVVHVLVGWSLLHWNRWTLPLALTVSVAEIVIVVTKLVLFLSAPEWTIWRTNWFINKIFVLAVFVLLLGYITLNASRLRALTGATHSARA
jgi:Ca2+/Na+ antiporter